MMTWRAARRRQNAAMHRITAPGINPGTGRMIDPNGASYTLPTPSYDPYMRGAYPIPTSVGGSMGALSIGLGPSLDNWHGLGAKAKVQRAAQIRANKAVRKLDAATIDARQDKLNTRLYQVSSGSPEAIKIQRKMTRLINEERRREDVAAAAAKERADRLQANVNAANKGRKLPYPKLGLPDGYVPPPIPKGSGDGGASNYTDGDQYGQLAPGWYNGSYWDGISWNTPGSAAASYTPSGAAAGGWTGGGGASNYTGGSGSPDSLYGTSQEYLSRMTADKVEQAGAGPQEPPKAEGSSGKALLIIGGLAVGAFLLTRKKR